MHKLVKHMFHYYVISLFSTLLLSTNWLRKDYYETDLDNRNINSEQLLVQSKRGMNLGPYVISPLALPVEQSQFERY
jgi:hypothetical protein